MMNIGPQIKKIRKTKRISLTELSQKSGIQIATLSRIENGKMTGTLESHFLISKALGMDIAEFYQGIYDEETKPILSSETELEAVSAPNDKVSREILSRQASSKKMLPTLMKIAAHGTTFSEKHAFGAECFVFVLEGELTVHIKEQQVTLSANASLYFNAAAPHHFVNQTNTPVKYLSILTPVSL